MIWINIIYVMNHIPYIGLQYSTIQYSAYLLNIKIKKENRISPLSSSVAIFQGKYAIQKTG